MPCVPGAYDWLRFTVCGAIFLSVDHGLAAGTVCHNLMKQAGDHPEDVQEYTAKMAPVIAFIMSEMNARAMSKGVGRNTVREWMVAHLILVQQQMASRSSY